MTENLTQAKTRAAVLCGGEGTRLRPLTNYFQKTMVPIGTRRKPLLEYIVRLLVYHGIPDMTLLTGYKSEEIEAYFADGGNFGARISYSRDADREKGSAQALMNAKREGKLGDFQNLIIYYGDIISSMDVRALLSRHETKRAVLTLVLSTDYKVPVGIAQVEDDRVVGFREKPTVDWKVTVGNMVISKECMPILERVTEETADSDLMTHFVPRVLENKSMTVAPFYINNFWYDIGTIEAYEKLDKKLIDDNLAFLDPQENGQAGKPKSSSARPV